MLVYVCVLGNLLTHVTICVTSWHIYQIPVLPWKYSIIDNIDSHLQGAKNLVQVIICIQIPMLLSRMGILKKKKKKNCDH